MIVPQRAQFASQKTKICAYQEVPLADVFAARRTGLIRKWGLRCISSGHAPSISCDGPQDAARIKRFFAGLYPFAFVELWQRMIQAGLLFDTSEELAQKWIEMFVERVAADGLFAQTFARDLLWADNALNSVDGNLEERLDALDLFRRSTIIRRFSNALSALLDGEKTRERAGEAVEILAWYAPRFALALLRRLSSNSQFRIRERLELLTLIINHSGKEYWSEACDLLARWGADAHDGWETLSTISGWFEALGPQAGGVVSAVAGAFADAVQRWFSASAQAHPLLEVLKCAEHEHRGRASSLPSLAQTLFHPAVENAATDDNPYLVVARWLVPTDSRRTTAVERQVRTRLREPVFQAFQFSFTEGRVIAPAARAFQCAVLADWAAALTENDEWFGTRDLLLGAVFDSVPAHVPAELRAVWREMERAARLIRGTINDADPAAQILREAVQIFDRRVNAIAGTLEQVNKWKPRAATPRPQNSATLTSPR
jgi:hypothetical protein